MRSADIKAVTALEIEASAYPWRSTHYAESLVEPCRAYIAHSDAIGADIGHFVLLMAPNETQLLNFVIYRQWQRQGYGLLMLAMAVQEALNSGASRVLLEVRAGNLAAQRLYQVAGFMLDGRRKGYYPLGRDAREDALLLSFTPIQGRHQAGAFHE